MNKRVLFTNTSAVSELVGGLLILIIAVVVSVTIYTQVLPFPIPPPEPNTQLMGYITEDGKLYIEHMGGETLFSYEIYVKKLDETFIYIYNDNPWEIGERITPPNTANLIEDEEIKITVYSVYNDGNKQIVFDGVLRYQPNKHSLPQDHPILISSLRTDSVDEDLICYNYSIEPSIDALSNIYNWLVKDGEIYFSITNLLMSFDTQSSTITKDYSGNNNNGIVTNATWNINGKIGGAYSFDGYDFISIPYCFYDDYIDEITLETWVKTGSNSGTIVSFDRANYWDLVISDGLVKWGTNSSDGVSIVKGLTNISDNNWHHVVATYDSPSGYAKIYIDGILDKSEMAHTPGLSIGSGVPLSGFIGKGTASAEREKIFSTSFETQEEKESWIEHNKTGDEDSWETLFYDDFESSDWGNWNDGGYDCYMYSGGTYAYEGICAISIVDDDGWQSSTYTDNIAADTAEYTQMSIDFWWIANSMENGENFIVNYYDGSNLHNLESFVIGTGEYTNDVFYHSICYLNETDYAFTNSAEFTIQCSASSNYDYVYLDKIYVNVSTGDRLDYEFNLLDSADINPRSGTYSIGGSGDFDPEYAMFNRTNIDISKYSDVKVTVWYSYINTEDTDFLGLYFLYEDSWLPIFEEDNPQIGSGQSEWIDVTKDIPEDVDNLVLQFKWMTSSSNEYVAIDDLEISGSPSSGESNFTGLIDEIKLYERVLSPEQIYQNYLCTKDGDSSKSIIVSEETSLWESWKCVITPNDGQQDDLSIESNILTIISYPGGN